MWILFSAKRNQEFLEVMVAFLAGAGKIQDECGTVKSRAWKMFISFKVEILFLGNYPK